MISSYSKYPIIQKTVLTSRIGGRFHLFKSTSSGSLPQVVRGPKECSTWMKFQSVKDMTTNELRKTPPKANMTMEQKQPFIILKMYPLFKKMLMFHCYNWFSRGFFLKDSGWKMRMKLLNHLLKEWRLHRTLALNHWISYFPPEDEHGTWRKWLRWKASSFGSKKTIQL